MNRHEEALQALRHALWLRERCDDEARAYVTRQLIRCVDRRVPIYEAKAA
jgi:hypothetical protein